MNLRSCAIILVLAFVSAVVAEGSGLLTGDKPAGHMAKQQHDHLQIPIRHSRKLQQRGYYYGRYGRRDRGYNTGELQLARNSAAIVNSQYAIRSAVESGAAPGATRAATIYSADQAWQAAQGIGPYPYGRWGGFWYGRRRL